MVQLYFQQTTVVGIVPVTWKMMAAVLNGQNVGLVSSNITAYGDLIGHCQQSQTELRRRCYALEVMDNVRRDQARGENKATLEKKAGKWRIGMVQFVCF